MALKASVLRIIGAHFKSLWLVYDPTSVAAPVRTPKTVREIMMAVIDILVLLVVPFVVGVKAAFWGFYPASDPIGWIVGFVSLTSGLLFSVLVLLFSSLEQTIASRVGKGWRLAMLEQLGGNVLFAVLIGFATAIAFPFVAVVFSVQDSNGAAIVPPWPASIPLGLVIMFVFHLGLILKRTHGLFVDTLLANKV